ncbi:MAG: UvrB/UvrC motif-containing protein [Crocinitomicaceae bacterium]
MDKKEIKTKIEELEAKKGKAVENGDYPYAALLRDQIKELKGKIENNESSKN